MTKPLVTRRHEVETAQGRSYEYELEHPLISRERSQMQRQRCEEENHGALHGGRREVAWHRARFSGGVFTAFPSVNLPQTSSSMNAGLSLLHNARSGFARGGLGGRINRFNTGRNQTQPGPSYPISILTRATMSTGPTLHQFVIYAPDCTDAGALERRLSVRQTHLAGAAKLYEQGIFRAYG